MIPLLSTQVKLYLFLKAIFITLRISVITKLNLLSRLIMRSQKILESPGQLVQYLTKCLGPLSDLEQHTSAISRNLVILITLRSKAEQDASNTTTSTTTIPKTYQTIPNYHKFNLKDFPPIVQTKGGSVSLGNANSFGILSGLACYLLTLKPKGIREPHWHHNAAELDYVINGRARMTIFSSCDIVDTFEVGPGEIVFIPSAYFHYIENLDNSDDMQFAVFFNHERPEDIGISGAFGAYSNEVLGSIFGLQPKMSESLPKYQEDLFVVSTG